MLERHVHERDPRLGEQLVGVPELSPHVHAAALLLLDERTAQQRPVDRHRPAVAQKDPPGDDREAVPGCEQAADLVQEGGDHPAVRQAGPPWCRSSNENVVSYRSTPSRSGCGRWKPIGLSPHPKQAGSCCGGTFTLLFRGLSPSRKCQRSPPRSKWALKKFSEPDVAIAAEAEISSASVAAATICANR